MKKFVSLVLVLALALSLCTVAFAVTYDYTKDTVAGAANWNSDNKVALTVRKVSDAVNNTYTSAGTTYKLTVPAKYMIDYKSTDNTTAGTYNGMYFLATSDCYDTVVVNGKTVTYLLQVDAVTMNPLGFDTEEFDVVKAEEKETGFVLAEDGECGKYYYTEDATLYVYDNSGTDVYYAVVALASATKYTVVDGKVVGLKDVTSDVAYKDHVYQFNYALDTAESFDPKYVTKVYCEDCKASFEFVVTKNEADAVAKFGEGNYEDISAATAAGFVVPAEYTCYVKTGTAAAGSSSTTVDSSKTFDAGVAMYVGLSLMSVAGSAVVIGKKKEF